MANLRKAKFKVFKKNDQFEEIVVQYNPNSLAFDKKPKIAAINIPGLDSPLQQFVRGEMETLTVELFFDSTEKGTGENAESVTKETDKFYGLVKIDPETHAPPICTFIWGQKFPGDSLPEMYQNQRRTEFKGLVTGVKSEFKLFSPEGTPLRAVLTISMNEYKPLHEQLQQLNLQSPDHTRSHVLGRGETLASVASDFYLHPQEWRHIAEANAIDDPRRLSPGTTLLLPPLR
jgi:nucleoid-associated protein YgaU